MKKLSRNKIALFLACASVLGGRVSAAQGMPLAAKVIAGTLGTLGGLEAIHSIIGVATNSKFGSYSIGRAIKNSLVDKKALIGKISGVMKDFIPIVDIISSEEYQNILVEYAKKNNKIILSMPFFPELFEKCAKEKKINLEKLSSRVNIDTSKLEKEKNELEGDYKARLLSLNLPTFNVLLNELNVEKSLKELEKAEMKVEYTANSMVMSIEDYRFTFTMNSNGSLTLEKFDKDSKEVDCKFTLMPPGNK